MRWNDFLRDLRHEEAQEISALRTCGFIGSFVGIVAVFLLSPIFHHSFFAFYLMQSGLAVFVLSTIFFINGKKYIFIPGLLLVLAFIILGFFSIVLKSKPLVIAAYSVYATIAFLSILVLLNRVLSAAIINTNMLFGALIIYLLSGIFWGKIFLIIEYTVPGSIHFTIPEGMNEPDLVTREYLMQFNLLYYSFTTLTTLGMGDIIPVHHLAKAMTAIEATYGQLFVGVVVAKLVSIWRHTKRDSIDQS